MKRGSEKAKNRKGILRALLCSAAFCCLLFSSVPAVFAVSQTNISNDMEAGSLSESTPVEVSVCPFAEVIVSPDHTGSGSPGNTLNYGHLIENKGNYFDTFEITYTSSLGWTYKFYTDPNGDGNPSDGVELKDTDGDGVIDTGQLAHCEDIHIVKAVVIPQSAATGAEDVMIITVTSSADPEVKDSAKNTTTVEPPLNPFGNPDPLPTPTIPVGTGVLPFTGAVLLPLFMLGGVLISAGTRLFRRHRIIIVKR